MSYIITDKNLIFKETFESEEAVERNGGKCTDITFSDDGAYFNGTSSKIDYGNTDKMKFNNSNKFSFRCVTKCLNYNDKVIFSKWEYATQGQYFLKYYNQNNISAAIANSLTDPINNYISTSNANTNYDDYDELVLVYNGAGTTNDNKFKIYKNGILLPSIYSGTIPSTLTNSSAKFTIGALTGTLTNYFNGYLKLIETYNKALTSEEVANLFNKRIRDIKDGLILDIDARDGFIQDRCGNSLTNNGCSVKKDKNTQSIFFYGSNNIQVANIFLTNKYTNSLWVKVLDPNLSASYISYNIGGSYTNAVRLFIYSLTDPSYSGLFASWNQPDTLIRVPATDKIKGRKYYHMCSTFDQTANEHKLYIDGILKVTGNAANILNNTGMRYGYSSGNNFQLNQIRIYNRVLSASEIAQLYNYEKKNYE